MKKTESRKICKEHVASAWYLSIDFVLQVRWQSQTTRALLFNNSSIFSNHGSIINDYAATTMATWMQWAIHTHAHRRQGRLWKCVDGKKARCKCIKQQRQRWHPCSNQGCRERQLCSTWSGDPTRTITGEDGKDHFIVLSLARGPTLQYVLNKEGGLGLVIAQCIAKQLISAISFLHGHAVIHRDISPANLVVSGAMLQDANWWSDEFDSDGKVLALTKKCKVTLIDFGFAIGKW